MGGYLGIGHSSAKTDRGNQLAGVNANWNVFNAGMPLAEQQKTAGTANVGMGMDSLQNADKFWKDIMSGNRTATAAAAQPAVTAATDMADAARKQEAVMGTSRGGGTNAGNQQVEALRRATISNDIFGVRPAAAVQSAQVGSTEAAVGTSQMQQALQALGLSEQAAAELINSSIQSRDLSYKINQDTQDQIKSVVMNLLGVAGGT